MAKVTPTGKGADIPQPHPVPVTDNPKKAGNPGDPAIISNAGAQAPAVSDPVNVPDHQVPAQPVKKRTGKNGNGGQKFKNGGGKQKPVKNHGGTQPPKPDDDLSEFPPTGGDITVLTEKREVHVRQTSENDQQVERLEKEKRDADERLQAVLTQKRDKEAREKAATSRANFERDVSTEKTTDRVTSNSTDESWIWKAVAAVFFALLLLIIVGWLLTWKGCQGAAVWFDKKFDRVIQATQSVNEPKKEDSTPADPANPLLPVLTSIDAKLENMGTRQGVIITKLDSNTEAVNDLKKTVVETASSKLPPREEWARFAPPNNMKAETEMWLGKREGLPHIEDSVVQVQAYPEPKDWSELNDGVVYITTNRSGTLHNVGPVKAFYRIKVSPASAAAGVPGGISMNLGPTNTTQPVTQVTVGVLTPNGKDSTGRDLFRITGLYEGVTDLENKNGMVIFTDPQRPTERVSLKPEFVVVSQPYSPEQRGMQVIVRNNEKQVWHVPFGYYLTSRFRPDGSQFVTFPLNTNLGGPWQSMPVTTIIQQ